MSDLRPIILLTRAQAQSERVAQELLRAQIDLQIVISPVLQIVFHPPKRLPAESDAFVATSENGIRAAHAAGISLSGKTVWCVGPRTAHAAKEMGANVIVGPDGADGLAQLIIQSAPTERLIYLCGKHLSVDIAKILNSAGIDTVSCEIYAQEPCEISPEARAHLQGKAPVILPIYSQMSARRLGDQFTTATAPLRIVAISEEVAKAWSGPKPQGLSIADEPTNAAMLCAIRSQFG